MDPDHSAKAHWYHQFYEMYRIPIILGIASIILIIISGILLIKSVQITTPIVFSDEASVAGVLSTPIQIDIEGAVVNPGVYALAPGSRVEDAILAAGGLSGEADEELLAKTVNRAAKVIDGAKLYVPKTGESTAPVTSYNIESSSPLVHINFASQGELEGLPGVGPVTAGKIISNRPYQTLEELVAKKAVGQSLFEKIKDQLVL